MVSLKAKATRVAACALAVLSVAGFICYIGYGLRSNDLTVVDHEVQTRVNAVFRKSASHRVWPATVEETLGVRPPKVPLDEDSMKHLASIRDALIQAYSRRQPSVLAEWRRKFPNMVETLPHEQAKDIIFPLEGHIWGSLRSASEGGVESFANAQSVKVFLDTVLEGTLLVGDIVVKNGLYEGMAATFEGRVFVILNKYKVKFNQDGLSDMEAAVDDAFARWSEFSESDQGYNKRYAMQQISLSRFGGFRVIGDRTWDEFVADQLENYSRYLVSCGYAPRWSKELPDVPEPDWYKTRRELMRRNN